MQRVARNAARWAKAWYLGVCLASRPASPVAGDSRPDPSHHAGGPGTGCVRPWTNERTLEVAEPGRAEPEPGRAPTAPLAPL